MCTEVSLKAAVHFVSYTLTLTPVIAVSAFSATTELV